MEALTPENVLQTLAAEVEPEQPQADSEPEVAEAEAEEVADDVEADAEAEEAEAEDDQPEPESSDDRVVEWTTASGEAFKVTERELRDGYLRQQDYTHKAQGLAEERKQAQASIQQQFSLVNALSKELGAVRALDDQIKQFEELDWTALRAQDPSQADSLRVRYLDLKEQRRTAEGQLKEADHKLREQAQQAFQESTQRALEHLKARIPKFNDQTLRDLATKCQKAGYSPQFLGMLADGLLMEDLWKARQWDDLQAKKPQVQNKVKQLPSVTAKKPARNSVPPTQIERVQQTLKSKRAFSLDEFAGLMKATR